MNSLAMPDARKLHFRLYTGRQAFDRKAALRQIRDLLEDEPGNYELEVLDGQEFRDLAKQDEVVMTPMLVRVNPLPVIRIFMPQQSSEVLRRALSSSAEKVRQ